MSVILISFKSLVEVKIYRQRNPENKIKKALKIKRNLIDPHLNHQKDKNLKFPQNNRNSLVKKKK